MDGPAQAPVSFPMPPMPPSCVTGCTHSPPRPAQHWAGTEAHTATHRRLLRWTHCPRPLQPAAGDAASVEVPWPGAACLPCTGAVPEALSSGRPGDGAVRVCPVSGFTSTVQSSKAIPVLTPLFCPREWGLTPCSASQGWSGAGEGRPLGTMLHWAVPESHGCKDLHGLKGSQRPTLQQAERQAQTESPLLFMSPLPTEFSLR